MHDSAAYQEKKRFYAQMITLYGRHAVEEVLGDPQIPVHTLHLAQSNKEEGVIRAIREKAEVRGITVKEHTRAALSRISKNGRQDQGVAVDIAAPNYQSSAAIPQTPGRLLALEGIHNPQNLGMIIRSAAAGNIDGIILPRHNSAKLSPLVMKASAGTLFKLPIYHCDTLPAVLIHLKGLGWAVYGLSSHAAQPLATLVPADRAIFVLGNESEGVSEAVDTLCSERVVITMNRGVESLNVAVTAALIAFMPS